VRTLIPMIILAACGTTTSQVKSGKAWKDARPSDYPATHEQVVASISNFCQYRDFQMSWNDDQSYLEAYRRADKLGEQSVELHVRIEAAPVAGMTRVTAISGRSSGLVWKGRFMHERLQNHLRKDYPPQQ